MRFKSKPTVVDAIMVPYKPTPEEIVEIADWFMSFKMDDWQYTKHGIEVLCRDGYYHEALAGDFIVRNPTELGGDFYPCPNVTFIGKYDRA